MKIIAKMNIRKLGVFVLVGAVLCACRGPERVEQNAIIVLPGAVGIRSGPDLGDQGLEYDLGAAQFDIAIQDICDELRSLGWEPLAVRWQNPPQAASYVDGWSCFPDVGQQWTFQWQTDWQDRVGNIVTYDVTTNVDVRDVRTGSATVRVIVIPAIHTATAKDLPYATGQPQFGIAEQCNHLLSLGTTLRRAP